MGKKKWYVILFYLAFVLIYALALSIPIGMVVKADDTAPADPVSEETTAEDPPPEDSPPEESPGEPPAESPAEPPAPEPVYVAPVVEAPPVVVVEQPPAVDVQLPAVAVEQPPAGDVQPPAVVEQPPAGEEQPPVTDAQPPTTDEQPAAETGAEPQTDVQPAETSTDAPVQPAAPVVDAGTPDGDDTGEETGGEPETSAVNPVQSAAGVVAAAAVTADATLAEAPVEPVTMIEALPEGANLVVLDHEGEALPLASSEAADTLVNGDPMYCAGTDAPGSASCHSYATIEAAINHAKVPGNGNCTIYVEEGYTSPTHNTITINGSDFDANSSINLFGGYNLVTDAVVGQTVLEQNFLISNITGSLTLANFLIQEFATGNNTVDIDHSQDVTLNNMDIQNSGNGNAVRISHSENVTIQNSAIREKANGFGVYVHTSDDVNIINTTIREYGNDGGIFVENSDGIWFEKLVIQSHDPGCSMGGCYTDAIRVNDGSNYTFKNITATSDNGSGLITDSGVSGYVRIFDSEFDDNGQRGISVFSGGPVSITNTTARDNLGDYGMVAQGSTLDLNGVHVDSNQNRGANLYSTGWINIQTSTFSGNHHNYGLYATSANQYINVNGISANGNDNFGAQLWANTYINVFNSQFKGNGFYGLFADAPDTISLYNVTSSGNEDDGVVLNSHGAITATCSVFSQNGQDGLESSMSGPHASLTLNSVTITGNHQAMDISGGSVVENLDYPCGGSSGGDGGDDGGTTTTTTVAAVVPVGVIYVLAPPGTEMIPVTGGVFVDLSCTGASSLRLPTGEATVFNQEMCGYKASMETITADDLPAPVPDPWTYVNGFTVTLMFGDQVVLEAFANATYTVEFPITNEQVNEAFHVLFWDTEANDGLGGWVDLGGTREALMWIKTHDRTGTFLLVK